MNRFPTQMPNQRLPVVDNSARRGFLLTEMLIGAVLIGAFLLMAVPTVRWVLTTQASLQMRSVAITELSNQMEDLAVLPAADRSAEKLSQLQISDSADAVLADAELTADAHDEQGLNRITLSLTWTDSHGMRCQPVTLTAWFQTASRL